MNIENKKCALVTGANRGIGKSIAISLAKHGIYVIGTSTTKNGVDIINSNFYKEKLLGEGRILNITKKKEIHNLLLFLKNKHKLPSILINNAGTTCDNLLIKMKDMEWYKVINTNLNSIFHLTKSCIRYMLKEKWGRIINISSIIGLTGNIGQTNYASSKSGIIGFTKSLAQEVGSRGITVNVIAPGFINTNMTKKIPDLIKEKIINNIPIKRLGNPEDISEVVIFLVLKGSYITGETIHVNGGMYMN